MRRNSISSKILILAALLAFCMPASYADTPGAHPGYLHALSDLRYARALLKTDFADDWPAIKEIDWAIKEAKQAAIEDHKPLSDHPPLDARLDRAGRLRHAVEALNSAERDMAQEEQNGSAIVWRDRSLGHIRQARNLIHAEMRQ